ncbi:MAG: hypothetical protein ABSB35_37230 [Bryobacteraceae bacterium]|jgi:hypothetical protein
MKLLISLRLLLLVTAVAVTSDRLSGQEYAGTWLNVSYPAGGQLGPLTLTRSGNGWVGDTTGGGYKHVINIRDNDNDVVIKKIIGQCTQTIFGYRTFIPPDRMRWHLDHGDGGCGTSTTINETDRIWQISRVAGAGRPGPPNGCTGNACQDLKISYEHACHRATNIGSRTLHFTWGAFSNDLAPGRFSEIRNFGGSCVQYVVGSITAVYK